MQTMTRPQLTERDRCNLGALCQYAESICGPTTDAGFAVALRSQAFRILRSGLAVHSSEYFPSSRCRLATLLIHSPEFFPQFSPSLPC